MDRRAITLLVLLAACGGASPAGPASARPSLAPQEEISSLTAITRAGCVRCHPASGDVATHLAAPAVVGDLAEAVRWHALDGGEALLYRHPGGGQAVAADLAAYVRHLGSAAAVAVPSDVPASAAARGEALYAELACGACHAPSAFRELARRVDFERLQRFLRRPGERHPDRPHPPLAADEATALAAWLLRAQGAPAATTSGFAWVCRELRIQRAGLPDLDGIEPIAQGVAARIDAGLGTREHHFALEFEATIDVPTGGAWTFVTGSDDSSWLWLDGELLVQNEGLAPHHRSEGTRELAAGPHALRVVYTQAAGGRSLEVRWRGPGQDEEELPAARARAAQQRFAPPPALPPPDPAAVARGRAIARAQRCDACHGIVDPEFTALSPPSSARPWHGLREAPCPQVPGAQALWTAARGLLAEPPTAALQLALSLLRDGCLACHVRDGRGGLPPAVRAGLREVEDLGEEGRLPPDLTAVGRRLRPQWLERVVREGHAVRPYLRVRMPAFGAAKARDYATWFAAVDGRPGDDVEPAFTAAAAQRGRELAGVAGKNCITCHPCDGHRALGPQGMDLAVQHERLQPSWFRDWLLHPTRLRPGTRMPGLWPLADAAAVADADALRSWSSLGAAAPLPDGFPARGALRLDPRDRPILHGAFLQGLSARCLAVGTPERTHFAFELGGARLAWLWRGDFLDASGTWSGRAGELLRPAGRDHVVLDELVLGDGAPRRLLGQRRTPAGLPVLQVAVGDAEYEDEVRVQLVAGGSEVVRTLRCVRGALAVQFPTPNPNVRLVVDGAEPTPRQLAAGQSLEVVYRW